MRSWFLNYYVSAHEMCKGEGKRSANSCSVIRLPEIFDSQFKLNNLFTVKEKDQK